MSATHPNISAQTLRATLAPHTDVMVRHSDSGQLVFARYGGRLLGLYPRADGPNALWVNPALAATLAAGEWLSGGERLWLAPERDFFYRDPANFGGVHVPTAIDPGAWQVDSAAREDTLRLSSTFDLYDCQQQQTYRQSCLQRTFRPFSDPYATGLDYVGVQIQDQVTLRQTPRRFCAWSITQVYLPHRSHPATALIPTRDQADILAYFDAIPAEQAEACRGYIRFRLDAAAIYKLAVRPEQLNPANPVKALCLAPCPDGTDWCCVVKRTQAVPRTQAECVDIARNPATRLRGVVQSYNHGPQAGESVTPHHFGEIEIQFNAAQPAADNSARSRAQHELLAYSGSRTQMLALAQQLLQLEQPPAVYPDSID